MLDKNTYQIWTSEFNPASYYKGSWDKNSKILFIGCDTHGIKEGMVSKIRENIPNKFVSIEHLGMFKGEEEIMGEKNVDDWVGAFENYTFNYINGKTKLTIDMDSNEHFKSYFLETWPKALNKLKEICEN